MHITYFLVATGSIGLPKLDIAVHATVPSGAIRDAAIMSQSLFKAGYWQFTLWDHTTVEPTVVAEFKVEQPDPTVTW